MTAPAPLLLDLSHTSHTRARTGIQRVARSLHAAFGARALAITHDPHLGAWRPLENWERENLATDSTAHKRGARWPLSAQLRGRTRRFFRPQASALSSQLSALNSAGLLVPEVFSPSVAAALPALFAAARGPRIALFHDAIALKYPEFTPAKTVARFPAYLHELLAFDAVAAVSEDSRQSLLDYWQWLGVAKPPPVRTVPLGVDPVVQPVCDLLRDKPPGTEKPAVLSVGSIEGRKNHLALLDACERLWANGTRFELRLIGLAHPQTGAAALARIRELQAAGRPLRYDGPASERDLEAAYVACTFTVYPSMIEGFGLPVIESLSHGKPCVCSARGALGESARGGGCLTLESTDTDALAIAIQRLLTSPDQLARLEREARARTFRTWRDYVDDLLGWTRELPRSNRAD
jgi:glycosyltransferase involved in cell wall biosynthesis